MADDQETLTTEETPAQRLIRERREKELQSKDNQHTDAGDTSPREEANRDITRDQEAGASQEDSATPDKTKLSERQEKHLEIDGEPRMGHAPLPRMNNVITGRHVGSEQNPSDLLKEDGSKSPHDVTSGGSRQAEGIRQAKDAIARAEEAARLNEERASGGGVIVTPTPEQAASGAAAEAAGRAE